MALSRSIAEERARAVAPVKHSRAEVERGLDQLSTLMDGLFRIPGTGWRFGLDAIVGLIPGVGDTGDHGRLASTSSRRACATASRK